MGIVPKPPITFIGAARNNYQPGRPAGIYFEALVNHTTAGGATIESLDQWFLNPQAGAATWFGIGPDASGQTVIHQYVSLADTAYAHGIVQAPTAQLVRDNIGLNPNVWAIGCELTDAGIPGNHTQAQRDLLAWLWAWLWESELMPHGAVTGVTAQPDTYRLFQHAGINSVDRANCASWGADRYDELIATMVNWLTYGTPEAPPPPEPEPPATVTIEGVKLGIIDKVIHDQWQAAYNDIGKILGA